MTKPTYEELERKIAQLESKVRESASINDIFLANTDVPFAYIDIDYTYRFVSHAYSEYFGGIPEDYPGKKMYEIAGDEIFEEIIKPNIDNCYSGSHVNYQGIVPSTIDRRIVKVIVQYTPIFDSNNQVIGVISILNDSSEEAMKEIEWKETINSVDDVMVLIRPDFSIEEINNQGLELLNKSKTEVIGKKCYEVFHDANHPLEHCPICKSKKSLSSESVEYFDEKNDKWFSLKSSPVFDENGRITKFVDIMRDISYVKSKESLLIQKNQDLESALYRLSDSEEKYKALYDNAPLAYQSLNEEGFIVDINPQWLKILGYERHEVIGKWFGDFLYDDFVPHFQENFPRFKAQGYIHDVQFKMKSKTGKLIYVSFEGCIGYYPDGSFRQTYCVFKDITFEKQAQEDLLLSQERFNLVMEATNDGIWDWDLITGEVYYSPGWFKMVGYSDENDFPADLTTWERLTHPDDAKRVINIIEELIERKDGIVFVSENRMQHKQGHWVNVLARGHVIRNEQNKPIRIIGTHVDLTERIRAQQELKASEERFDKILKTIPDMVSVHDTDFNIVYSNWNGIAKVAEAKQKLNTKCYKTYRDCDSVCNDCMAERIFKSKIPTKEDVGLDDGTWLDVNMIPLLNDAGEAELIVEWVRDITKRKNIELELVAKNKDLEESDSRLKALQNASFGGIAIHQEGKILECNKALSEISGYSYDELIGMAGLNLIHPDDRDVVYTNIAEGYEKAYEVRGLRKDGSIYNLQIEGRNIPYKGQPVRSVEFRDISHFKSIQNELIQAKENIEANEERLNTLVSNLPGTVYECKYDKDWTMQFLSTGVFEMTGYEIDDILENRKLSWNDIISPEYQDLVFEKVTEGVDNRTPYRVDYEITCADGEKKFVWEQGQAVYENGKPIALNGIIIDITKQRAAELQLIQAKESVENSKRKLNTIMSNLPGAIYECEFDRDWTMLYMSRGVEELTGYKPTDFMQNGEVKWNTRILEEYRDRMWEVVQKSIETGTRFTANYEFRCKDGTVKYFWEQGQVVFENGKAVALHGLILDITKQRKAELELVEAKEIAIESNKLKTEFLNNMSHEIRTPMNGILGFAELLSTPNLTETNKTNYINVIKNSSHQLLNVIDDILEISKLETKQVVPRIEKVNLNDLMLGLFSIFNLRAKQNKVPLYLNKELPDNQSWIDTDETKLNKILSNLIENAIKFTNKGFIEFGYRLNDDKSEIQIYIKDTGIGISQENLDLIFHRFSQVEKELSRKSGGLGLGLSIAQENAELIGGRISLESIKGEGSTFYLNLPFDSSDESKSENLEGGAYKILIAEDEEINYLFLQAIIEDIPDFHCQLLHAKNGIEAVEICKNNPDLFLVLMDIKMPQMNGFEATKQIKEIYPKMTIIAQTAYTTNEDREKALAAGCEHFISKPINREVLSMLLNEYLDEKEK
jgi:PAS domain S-box-containing protein